MQKFIYTLIKLKFIKNLFGKILLIYPKFFWKFISNGEENYEYIKNSPDYNLIEVLNKFKEINSLIELGTGYGDRLKFISDELKIKRVCGIDINKSKVYIANNKFRKLNRNVMVYFGDITSKNFYIKDVDIVITSMTLIYLKEKELKLLLLKLLPKIKKGFIFQEFVSEYNDKNETFYNHDFKKILIELDYNKKFKIKFDKINYLPWNKHNTQPFQIYGSLL